MQASQTADLRTDNDPILPHKELKSEKIESFPDWVMSGVAERFAKLYSRYTEFPQEFLYFGFLCILGSIVAGILILKSELSVTTRLYIIFLGESGYGRKSSSINAIVDFFKRFFPGRLVICEGVGSAEGLLKQIQSASNGHLLLSLDELKALTGKMTIDSSILLPCINTLFENTSYQSSTKNTATRITDAHLSILAASTLETYDTLWIPQFLDIGFPNRLFLVPGSRKKRVAIPEQIPKEDKQALSLDVATILSRIEKNPQLDLTPEARSRYEEWYSELKESVHTKRLDTYAMRFMLLIAANDQKDEVDLETVEKVIAIMNWQEGVRKYLDPIDADNRIAMMEEKIRRELGKRGELSERDLKNFTNAGRSGNWVFQTALTYLSDKGDSPDIKRDPHTKKWRLLEQV